jgi:hypothetical protein
MSDGPDNLHPSTAHLDPVTRQYVHDPLNQPYAEHAKLGNLQPRPVPQREHISRCQGYCEHGVLGGCEKDSE